MKKIYVLLTVVSLMSVAVSSCSKDSIEADKEGIEMRMRNEDEGNDYIYLLKVDSAVLVSYYYQGSEETYYQSTEAEMHISSSNNFHVSMWNSYGDVSISCVGSVSGLSGIKKIPEGGWTNQIAVQPGQGYVIRHKNGADDSQSTYRKYCRYARVYVVEWIEGVDGGILGATIRYQDNWKIED